MAFQRHYGRRPVTGELADVEEDLRAFHDQARLPVVPADGDAEVAVPAAPPPPPPPTEGHEKLGDGEPRGQGVARSDMTDREVRLLDFEQNPASRASCHIEVARFRHTAEADEHGVAVFRAPRAAGRGRARWSYEGAIYERGDVELLAHHQPDTFQRLGNLGFSEATLEQRVRAYQHAFDQPDTGREEDVAEEVRRWHDGGEKPGSVVQDSRQSLIGNDVQRAAFLPPIRPLPPPPGIGKIFSTVGPVVIGGVGPFLVVKPPRYVEDATMAAQFTDFATQLPKAALSVTELSNPNRPYFGVRDDEVHYSASTCKSIALVTATLLLAALRRHARAVGLAVPANKLLDKAAADFRDAILAEAQSHPSLKPAPEAHLLPSYHTGFVVTGATGSAKSHSVDFSSKMVTAIDQMMGVSSNNDSATVIHNAGFGYIHGALTHAGLFKSGTDTGLWLAGDYTGSRTARRIPAVNDTDTAQGATTRTFVSMLDMALDAAFPDTSFLADKFALSRIQHPSWLTEPDRRSRQKKGFFDERGKIGDGQLKGTNGGHFVFSELIELRHIQTGRRFLVSYQNTRSSELDKVSDIVLDGLAAYVKATTP